MKYRMIVSLLFGRELNDRRRSRILHDFFRSLLSIDPLFLLIFHQHPLFFFLLPLFVLKGSSEEKIHDQNLIGYDDRYQQNREILRMSFQIVDEKNEQGSIVDDLSKQDNLVCDKLRHMSLCIAYQRKVQICKNDLNDIDAASCVLYVEVASVWKDCCTSEDIEE